MGAILSFLVIIVVSMLVVRVATVALTLTGLSKPLARFQARSAFTGAGFTTTESEKVVHHPVRRKIIMILILLGNAGIVTSVTSLMLTFAGIEEQEGLFGSAWFRIFLLMVALFILYKIASSEWLDRQLSRYIGWALNKWTTLEVRDYSSLLHLSKDYAISELYVNEGNWMANQRLRDLRLSDEGVVVLGVEKQKGLYVGAPRGETEIKTNDTLLVYGRQEILRDLEQRQRGYKGHSAHFKAVEEQRKAEIEEEVEQKAEEESDEDQQLIEKKKKKHEQKHKEKAGVEKE